MEKVNLRAIRDQLPQGSINVIAKEVGCNPRVVGEVLNKGRARNYRNAVVAVALKIIRDQRTGDVDVVKEAKELDLASGNYSTIPYKQKKKQVLRIKKPWYQEYWYLILIIVPALALLFFGKAIGTAWKQLTNK